MKSYTITLIIIITSIMALMSSCSIHKRSYRDGFQVEWHIRQKAVPEYKPNYTSLAATANEQNIEIAQFASGNSGFVSPPDSSRLKSKKEKKFNLNTTKNEPFGNVINTKSDKKAKYKHNDGTKIKDEPKKEKQNNVKQYHPYALFSLLSCILGIGLIPVIGSIVSIILASIALKEINNEPDKYRGKWMSLISMIISTIMIAIVLFFLIFIIILFFVVLA